MTELVFHHYASSPFAEKIRLVFGYKGLVWRSVYQPSIMPKPHLTALTGGYRRIPVLQIGADIYCDTALICETLEAREPERSLYPKSISGAARVIAQWADSTLFWAAMAYNFQPAAAAQFFDGAPEGFARAFAEDRKAMRRGADRIAVGDATPAYKSYLRRISSMLEGQDFLLGAQPTIADFAVYHPLWFTQRVPAIATIFDATPNVSAWINRMAALGHGQSAALSPEAALELAKAATPRSLDGEVFQDEHGFALGSAVSVTAESFGTESSEGTLVAATRTRYVIARSLEDGAAVHVHFPRIGYVLKAQSN